MHIKTFSVAMSKVYLKRQMIKRKEKVILLKQFEQGVKRLLVEWLVKKQKEYEMREQLIQR